jgi:carbon storage regulator
MLVLARRVGESLVVNDNIVVTVLGVQGDQVRIGVDAPRDIMVFREEIYRKRENHGVRSRESSKLST